MMSTRMLRGMGKPLVDAQHMKRRSHLKSDHLPTSEKHIDDTAKDDEMDMCDETISNKNQRWQSFVEPGDKCKGEAGVASMRANVNDVARLGKQLLGNTFGGF